MNANTPANLSENLSPPLSSKKISRFTIVFVSISIFMGIAILVSVLFAIAYINERERAYEREIARIHKLGLPTNSFELNAYYHYDPELDQFGVRTLNALTGYNISHEMEGGVYFRQRFAKLGARLSKEDADALRQHVHANTRYLEQIWQVMYEAYSVGSRYPVDLTRGYDVDLRFLPEIENAVRMLAACTQLAVEDGRNKEALESLYVASSLEESLRDIPLLIAQYHRIQCYEMMRGQLEFALNARMFSREEIGRLHQQVAWANFDGITAFGLMGDRAAFSLAARDLRSYMPNIAFKRAQIRNIYFGFSELIAIGDLPTWERRESAKAFESHLNALYERWGFLTALQMLALPHAEQAYVHENGAIAQKLTVEVALEMVQFCIDESRIPKDFSELVPKYRAAVPIDPFDGQPLRYSPRGEGFVVYSVGRDLRDDGGLAQPEDKREARKSNYDIVFRILDARSYCGSIHATPAGESDL